MDKSLFINLDTQMVFLEAPGVSITHGHSRRSHVQTFAASGTEVGNGCQCGGGGSVPPLVKTNYYCESGYNDVGIP